MRRIIGAATITLVTKFRLALIWAFTLFVWSDVILYLLRIDTPFHRLLFKAPRLWFVLGLMVVLPAVAAISGVKRVRKSRADSWGWINAWGGALCLVAFALVIGVPMLIKALEKPAPKNPSTPRAVAAQVGLPVFPGAEGFGTRTPAGRDGKVIAVTSLEDNGPGSLRAALEASYPRTVVFRVGGIIRLKDHLLITHPFVTVAGQTAPGDGICLADAGLVIATHDVLIQHLRIRPGNEGPVNPEDNDAIGILGKFDSDAGAHHIVLDHLSMSWSEDELLNTWSGARDITISWCILSEALNRSRHQKRTHSAGLLIGNSSEHVSVHHCLFAHNDFRNPLIIDGGTHDIVNNVAYDWGVLPAEIVDSDSNSFLNFIGNTFIAGPSTKAGPYEILINHGRRKSIPKIYVEGNLGPHRTEATADEWSAVGFGFGRDGVAPMIYRANERFPVHAVTAQPAEAALRSVLEASGATRPRRDATDQRIIAEVKSRQGAIIDSPGHAGGYAEYSTGSAPMDFDGDGMTDDWERTAGLNPADAADANGDLDKDGYTNLEEYLHSL